MKKSLLLVFTYLILQLCSAFIVKIGFFIYQYITTGVITADLGITEVILSLLLSMLLMFLVLWKKGLIPMDRESWSLPKPSSLDYLLWVLIATFSSIFLLDLLMSYLSFLPNLMEQTFSSVFESIWGIIAVTLIGPLLEELIFRGAVTRFLLEKYTPRTAILVSALIFGLIHMNPTQVIGGFILGLLLAWVYFKTKSILPVLIIHIVNNSLSVMINKEFVLADSFQDIIPTTAYWLIAASAVLLLIASLMKLNQATASPFLTVKEEEEEVDN